RRDIGSLEAEVAMERRDEAALQALIPRAGCATAGWAASAPAARTRPPRVTGWSEEWDNGRGELHAGTRRSCRGGPRGRDARLRGRGCESKRGERRWRGVRLRRHVHPRGMLAGA